VRYLVESQRPDGSWVPLWFGNEHAPGEDNPTYGTARTLSALQAPLVRGMPGASACADKAAAWLLQVQNSDGGWGGAGQVASTVEETGVVLAALGQRAAESAAEHDAISRGARWLAAAIAEGAPAAAPIGLYFARLWYYEAMYPLIFGLAGLATARETLGARV
jgi:squalene-hopene/tetraprenyl-beta-curcumene cyclase